MINKEKRKKLRATYLHILAYVVFWYF